MKHAYLITCEHAVNDVPAPYLRLFEGKEYVLKTHRAWDPGAWEVATRLAMLAGAPLLVSSVTRLLVDLNRSETNPELFSEFTRGLPEEERRALVRRYHRRYRRNAEDMVEIARQRNYPVTHLSIHSFTPELDGEVRDADITLLLDDSRHDEAAFCESYLAAMREISPGLRYKKNYPYEGIEDGLTTTFREKFPPHQYCGIELELNHGPYRQDENRWREMADTVVYAFEKILES